MANQGIRGYVCGISAKSTPEIDDSLFMFTAQAVKVTHNNAALWTESVQLKNLPDKGA
jgi:hypothetical protein